MPTDLEQHITQTPLVDTHEHLRKETDWVQNGPGDVLADLFTNYVPGDLIAAGADPQAVSDLTDSSNQDLTNRFEAVRPAWESIRHTGYAEAVRISAEELYGIGEWTADALAAAQKKLEDWRRPGGRYHLLTETANLDHVQTDDGCWPCEADASGPDFFFYDITWRSFSDGTIDFEALQAETGTTVDSLATLTEAMEQIFIRYASRAIAVKAQHAYSRTLRWEERSDGEASRALETALAAGGERPVDLILGDWCWARGVELATEHNLPFKLHTGYYAGNSRMPVDYIKGGNLCSLLAKYGNCRFVLMHIAYPYCDELVSLAKHYPNVYPDLCWAWSIDPFSAADFVRRYLHGAPANKLFAFGGDTLWPTSSTAYAIQARRWLNRALQGEVDDGYMSEAEAMAVATRLMRHNQYACFDLDGKRAACAA